MLTKITSIEKKTENVQYAMQIMVTVDTIIVSYAKESISKIEPIR